jgi:hypothetical protein
MQTQQDLLLPFEPDGELVYVKWFRSKSGKIIHASAYGKKCFVFRRKTKND